MLAIGIMTTDVASLKPDATVREAAQLLLERGISGAPMIDDAGQLVGIVSEGDLLHRVELDTEKRHRSRTPPRPNRMAEQLDHIERGGVSSTVWRKASRWQWTCHAIRSCGWRSWHCR